MISGKVRPTKAHILAAVQKTQAELKVNSFEFKATVVAIAAITIPTLHVGSLSSFTGYPAKIVKAALNQMQHEIIGQLDEDLQAVINELQTPDSDKADTPSGVLSVSEDQQSTIEEQS